MNKRFFNQQNLTRRLRLLPVLFAMLLMPLSAWAEDYDIIVGDVPVTNENASNIFAENEYLDGKVSFTVEDNKNVLILDGANLMEYPIVSDLTNLTIRFKDDCSLFTITSNKTNATLRFEKAADADDGTQLTGSGLGGSPWSGFDGGVTFGGNLAYFTNSDTWYINNLSSPKISVENSAVSFGVSFGNNIIPITNANDFNFFYTLQYEDENQQSVTTFTQYDPQNPLTINKASVLTVKARYKYAEDYSDVSIGKYFGAAEDPMRLVYGADPVDFVLAPAIEEGDGIIINGIEANVTYNTGKVSSSTLGRNGAIVSLGYVDANNKTTTLLNNYFNMSFDVVPPAPTIGLAEGTYSSTHEAITVTSDGLVNTTIKYQWDDDDEEDYPETGIPFQAGTLKAWVVYTNGETSLSSDIVSATYTVLSEAGLQYVVGDDPVEDVDYVIGGTGNELTLPTLLNPHNVSVTYASGNTAIATVDETTGVVTPVGVGSTTITAKSTATTEYAASEASYWLNVYKDLSHSSITVEVANVTYNGQAKTPTVTVKDGDKVLMYGEDNGDGTLLYEYKVEYANNTNAALATAETNAPTATITALTDGSVSHMEVNWYRGSTTKTFTISPMSISTATVSVDATQTYTYTGSEIKPSVLVSIYLTENAENITTLTEGTDYTVTGYANNTNAATATSENAPTITITGKGNFTGTATGTFTIDQASLGDVTIAPIADQAYTGDQITPAVTVTFNDAAVSTEDYNVVYGENTNAGENAGTVTLTSKNKNFVTSTDEDATTKKTATFNIVAAAAAITATDQTVTFDGEEQPFTNYTIANGTPRVTYYSSEEARTAQSGGTTSAPTEAAIYYVQVTQGDDNYTSAPADATFTISPMTLTSEMVTLSATSFVYSGAAQTPDVTVADGDNILTINTNYDYVIKQGETVVASPMNVGSYSVVVTGKGNYTGTATKTFTIAAKDLASATVTVDPNQTYTYTGSAITPNVSSVSIKLTEGADAATNLTSDDYTVTGYANNTDAALATAETNAPTVTITGKGNFTGTATGTFTIAQAKLSAVTIAAIGNQTFTGSQITPGVTVTFNEKTVSTDEYNVVYGDNINAGENAGTVTLTSKNKNFVTSTDEDATTKKTATFNIVAAAAAITATDQTVTFDGEEQPFTNYTIANGTPRVTYYSSEEARTAQSGGTTSAPTEAAIYYVQVTQGDANYTSNPANATFTISPMTLTSEMVILSETNFEYTGGVRKPEVTVEVEENVELYPDDNYTVSYQKVVGETATAIENPIDVGDYNVVVTGKGNYTGTVTKQFSIGKTPATVTAPIATNPTYTGSAQNLVTAGATESGTVVYSLSADGEFTETIPQATDAGSYTVYYKATGDDNHSESAVGNVAATIAQANLGDVTIAEIGTQTYTGSQIKPEVTVTFGGKAVSEEEYTIGYGTNTNVGEGTVTLTSENKNFSTSSTKGATFTIVAKELTAAMVADIAAQTYSGTELKPALTVKDGETTLEEDTHYEVTYSNNKNAGTTAKATITGKGNYSGSIDKFFTINKAQLTVTADDKTYNVGDDITLTVTITGFVNGETKTVLTTQPTASCDADVTKPGSYTITVNGGVAQNYDFIYGTGTLTINRQLTVSFSASNTWATYCGTENLSTPEGLKAYQVTAVEGATVTISEIGYIPANTAVLLQNVSNNNTWTNIAASAYTGATSTFENNKLIGTASAVDVSTITDGTVYILVNNMFRRSTSGSIPANRGYLVVEPSAVNAGNAPQLSISIGDENTTGVQTLNAERGTLNDDSWYTIDGRKLQQAPAQKGLYIKNGKKVFINKK